MFRAYEDNQKGFRGRVVVKDMDHPENTELIFKHPFLLKLRCWLAKHRIIRRQRKLAKFNSKG